MTFSFLVHRLRAFKLYKYNQTFADDDFFGSNYTHSTSLPFPSLLIFIYQKYLCQQLSVFEKYIDVTHSNLELDASHQSLGESNRLNY